MQHLDEGTIHAWLDGELPFAEREAAEAHAASCAECAAAVAEARGFIAASSRILTALDAVPGGVLPASSGSDATRATETPRRFTISRAWMAVAAVLVLGIGTVIANRPGREAAMSRVAGAGEERGAAVMVPHAAPPMADSAATRAAAPAPADTRRSAKATASPPAVMPPAKLPKRAPATPTRDLAAGSDASHREDAPISEKDAAPAMVGKAAPAPAAAAPRRLTLSEVIVTGAGTPAPAPAAKLGATIMSDSAAPQLVSRSSSAVLGDTVVTTIYRVHGVRVSLVDRPARMEVQRATASNFSDAVMAKARAPAPAENSITWSDSTGRTRTLRGAMPQAELERLRERLFGATP